MSIFAWIGVGCVVSVLIAYVTMLITEVVYAFRVRTVDREFEEFLSQLEDNEEKE